MSEENSNEEVEKIEEPQATADKTVVDTKDSDTVDESKSSEDKTSVKKAVHKYKTIKTANDCHSGSNNPSPTPPTTDAITEDAPVLCIVMPSASIP